MLGTMYRGVSLLSIVVLEAAQYNRMSRSTHCASSGGRPNSIQGRNPGTCYTCCVTRTIRNRLLTAGLRSRVPLARLPLTPRHRQALWSRERVNWRLWNDALWFLVMRVDSVFMRVIDVYVYGVDLVSVIFRSVFTHDTQAPPQASWYESHQ